MEPRVEHDEWLARFAAEFLAPVKWRLSQVPWNHVLDVHPVTWIQVAGR